MPSDEIVDFWTRTRAKLDEVPLEISLEPSTEHSGREYTTYCVTLTSLDRIRIRAWYSVPKSTSGQRRLAGILTSPGYGGEKPIPVSLVQQGCAVLTLFPRGQGESKAEWNLEFATKLTYHITDRERFYYRGAFMDCIRGLDFLCSRPEIDPSRLAAWGRSQGGGLTLAVASLDERLSAAVAEEPFLCNYPISSTITRAPYRELYEYILANSSERDEALRTLAFFDPLNLGDAIRCPTLMNIGLKDETCPYETIFPVFSNLRCLKGLLVYPDLDHNPCADFNVQATNWLAQHVG